MPSDSYHHCQNNITLHDIRTFAQDGAVDSFQSGTYQGRFYEFLGRRDAAADFASCHHAKNYIFFLILLLTMNANYDQLYTNC
jgi:hypothetical protein